MRFLKNIFISMRIKQWAKNIFVFAPLFFELKTFSFQTFLTLLAAFSLFSFLSSGIYLLNDVVDRKEDAKDPVKRKRPVASGELNPMGAMAVSGLFFLCSLFVSFRFKSEFGVVLVSYLALNLLYFAAFKALAILDVFTVSSLFVIRVVSGFVILGTEIPVLLVLTVFFLAQFLLFVKRYFEHSGEEDGKYPTSFLEKVLFLTAPLLLVSFMLFSLNIDLPTIPIVSLFGFALVYLGVLRVLYKISIQRTSLQAYDVFILKDPFLLSVMIGFVILYILSNLVKVSF